MYKIAKTWNFAASHQLRGLSPDHKCMRLHGHTYHVELQLKTNQLDSKGMIVDYGDLTPFGDFIRDNLDHRHLNDIIEQPTAENLAKHLYNIAKQIWKETSIVKVWESSSTWAEYKE